jgi:Uma2 family endonuclease
MPLSLRTLSPPDGSPARVPTDRAARYNSSMSTATRLITAEELLRMPEEETRWCELVDGEIVRMSPPRYDHAIIISQNVALLLMEHVNRRQLGRVIISEAGFIVARSPDTVFAPDGAFIRKEREDAIGIPRAYFPEAPALVFEVVSPNDRVSEVSAKMRRWLAAGVELAWVIDPELKNVTVYRSLEDIRVLTEKDTLTGEPVLPDFSCTVADFFAAS